MKKTNQIQFSVLMSVYKNDKPENVATAIKSVTENQTVKPSEIILMVDGPISDSLKDVLISEESKNPILKIKWCPDNRGLGPTLQDGLVKCSNELVARMDADDIAMPSRFEKQLEFMENNPEIAVVGGQISEFIDTPENIVAYRTVPCDAERCRKYYRNRDPLNHMTVMFRRSAILDAGNYQPWHLDEDSYLWGRLLKKGYKIANIPEVLVNARAGAEMYARRGGWKYFQSDTKMLRWKRENGFLSWPGYMYNYFIRFTVQVLMPNSIRSWVFTNLLRKKPEKD